MVKQTFHHGLKLKVHLRYSTDQFLYLRPKTIPLKKLINLASSPRASSDISYPTHVFLSKKDKHHLRPSFLAQCLA